MGPRDTPTRFGIPVDLETGRPIEERQIVHLEAVSAAGERLLEAMHYAEGSNGPGEHQEHVFQTRRMKIAAGHIEIALMFARREILESK